MAHLIALSYRYQETPTSPAEQEYKKNDKKCVLDVPPVRVYDAKKENRKFSSHLTNIYPQMKPETEWAARTYSVPVRAALGKIDTHFVIANMECELFFLCESVNAPRVSEEVEVREN